MSIVIVIVCLGAALGFALLVVIYQRVAAIERATRARARPEAQALEATRVDAIVKGLEAVAEEMRGRATDLRAIHDEEAELLINLRRRTVALAELTHGPVKQRSSAPPRAPDQDDEQRATIEMPRPTVSTTPPTPADADEPEEEPTQVASRPIAGTPAAPNGLRLAPSRPAIPPPPASRKGSER